MNCNRFLRRVLEGGGVLGLSLTLGGIGLSPIAPAVAQAANTKELSGLEQKAEWQQRYRRLLQGQQQLRAEAATSRENYARAKRRNYPRGGALQQFLIDAEKAESELVELEQETAEFLEQARGEAIPRNWFYEVDDEDIRAPSPVATRPDDREAADDRAGRNPLYLDVDVD